MAFTEQQLAGLTAKLDASHVKQREQAGQTLSYIEGWHAIAEANRIFGFDAWDRETVHVECVWSGERQTRKGTKPAASYVARVRVCVRAGDTTVTREGTGAGSGFGNDVGEAHESAIKEAETDAMKRALMTFGNPFGLALYDKSRENVEAPAQQRQQPARQQPPQPNPALVVQGAKDAADWLDRLIGIVSQAPDAATVQAIHDANRKALDKLQTADKPKWDAAMKALGDATTNVLNRSEAA